MRSDVLQWRPRGAISLPARAGTAAHVAVILLSLFADVAMNPAFKDAEIGRMRSQMLAALQKKIDNPSSFADEKMDQFVFGSHPYGRDVNGTPEGLRSINKHDIIKHYLTFYRPNNASLAVVGNFDGVFENKIQEVFGKWTKRTIPEVAVAAPPVNDSSSIRECIKINPIYLYW
ncbi:M16 family metallopeptidase [Ectopseudomonas mendocina]|uniref:M16 family metallopeptidase n=1 Tax=Ectopseudomonas mendocina TaxID=300 RepID=UPI001C8F7C38|nr:insulinase family protein [Pseudomonas mendocina]